MGFLIHISVKVITTKIEIYENIKLIIIKRNHASGFFNEKSTTNAVRCMKVKECECLSEKESKENSLHFFYDGRLECKVVMIWERQLRLVIG